MTHRSFTCLITDSILVVVLGRVVGLPTTGREYVLISFVPTPKQNLSGVRFVPFDGYVAQESDIIVDIEAE